MRRILLLSDLHIGSIKNIAYVYNTIIDIIDKECIYNKVDAVIFLGDYFHQLLKCNSEYTILALNVMNYLMRVAKTKRFKVRMIYGTESHDCEQYCLFSFFEQSPDFDFKVVLTAQSEELFPGYKVLYLPEEHVYDKKTYYEKLLSKNYDYIFGHGMIEEGMPVAKFNSSNSTERKVPVFKAGELASISKICVFGHYHIYTNIGNGVYYVGSLFRNAFGEENPKGYGIIEDSKFRFIENKDAYIFKTYTYDKNSPIFKDMNSFMREWLKLKIKHKSIFDGTTPGKLRLIFNLPETIEKDFKEKIKSLFLNEKHVNAVFNDEFVCDDMTAHNSTEYDYITDDNLQVEDKIHNFINQNYNYDLSIEDIGRYIKNFFKL